MELRLLDGGDPATVGVQRCDDDRQDLRHTDADIGGSYGQAGLPGHELKLSLEWTRGHRRGKLGEFCRSKVTLLHLHDQGSQASVLLLQGAEGTVEYVAPLRLDRREDVLLLGCPDSCRKFLDREPLKQLARHLIGPNSRMSLSQVNVDLPADAVDEVLGLPVRPLVKVDPSLGGPEFLAKLLVFPYQRHDRRVFRHFQNALGL